MDKSEARRRKPIKKVVGDPDEARRKREDNIIEIRKQKKEEALQKRRNVSMGQDANSTCGVQDKTFQWQNKLQNMYLHVQAVMSDDSEQQLEGTIQFRKILSIERNAPIEAVIQSGVVPRFTQFLLQDDNPQLQFEAAWALTNVASGTSEHTRAVIESGAVVIFVQLLRSPSEDVREQAVWALGNIAGDSTMYRDLVLESGALTPLLDLLVDGTRVTMQRNVIWTLSNFCRGKPQPNFEVVRRALPTLARLIDSLDGEVVTDVCWALSYLSDGPNDRIQEVIQSGVCRKLVELLGSVSNSVLVPALRTIGNIVTGDDSQTQIVINCGVLAPLLELLQTSFKKSIKKEACWTVSNITAGTTDQIQAVIEAGIVPPVIELMSVAEFDIKKEAAWCISNATSGGRPDQIEYMVQQGCIKPLCDLLCCNEARVIVVALEALKNILELGETLKMQAGPEAVNPYTQLLEDANGLLKLEDLQEHQNEEIYRKALAILDNFFDTEEMVSETINVPGLEDSGAYQFGKGMQHNGASTSGTNQFNFGGN
eukprot:TRINITY_DN2221_c0_g1_i7.p1 TRINITY_DN2221_c0_g1~~TRINITY_DN2221_c0_g1_i7.p1  ORF type:complete len:540 (-),score=70.83 TRINITY_DN2221_c0_g1_i7:804-2423(-)